MPEHPVKTRRRVTVDALLVALVAALGLGTAAGSTTGDLAAARKLQSLEQWALSESLATAVLVRLERERSPDSMAVADALYLVGVARWKRVGVGDSAGAAAASRSLTIRERGLPPRDLEIANGRLLHARFLNGVGKSDSARSHVRMALDIQAARLPPGDTLIAKAWDQMALIERDREDFRACLDAWHRAIEIRERAHGRMHPEVARLIAQTSVPWMELEELDQARHALEESLDIYDRTVGPDYAGRWIPLNNLSNLEQRIGDAARCLDAIQEAVRLVRLAKGENSRDAITLRYNLAFDLSVFGDFAGARTVHAELHPLFVSQYGPTHERTLTNLWALGVASGLLGDTTAAAAILAEVDSLLTARGGPPGRTLALAQLSRAKLAYRCGRDAEARALAERACRTTLAARQPSRNTLADAQGLLVLTLAALGDTAALVAARAELARLQTDLGGAAVEDPVLQSHLASASRYLGRSDEAWALALDAERLARERVRRSLRALPERRALLFSEGQEPYLDQVMALARGSDREHLAAAWDRLVRWRGMVGAEVANRWPPPGLASDTAVAGAHGRWIEARRRLAQREVAGSASRADSLVRVSMENLRWAAEQAEAAYVRSLAGRGMAPETAETGIDDVRARLRPGEALVAFLETPRPRTGWYRGDSSAVLAFVARGGSDALELIDLGRSDVLREVVETWQARLALPRAMGAQRPDSAEAECRRLGSRARTMTWDRIAAAVQGASDIYVVGDGPVLDISWQALPIGDAGYLVESSPRLHVLNAERELVELASAGDSYSLLAIGAPDFDRGAGGPTLATAVPIRSAPDPCVGVRQVLSPLPGSDREVRGVARAWRKTRDHAATILTGAAASEQAFKRDAPGHAALHLATHGVVGSDTCGHGRRAVRGFGGVEPIGASWARTTATPGAPSGVPSPWMSRRVWLAFAGANRALEGRTDGNEGLLTAEEVSTMNLAGTDWVVLSVCQAGVAEAWSREGALGMRRAFDIAGARTVIASQWMVSDDDAGEWMEALYQARAAGASTAAALQSASRAVLASRRKHGRSTHPFSWAAFTASGR